MKKQRIMTTLWFSLLTLFSLTAQEIAPDFSTTTYDGFVHYYQQGIAEKVYVQTDKPYYSAGEDIWFKGYAVNAITHTPTDLNGFMYVELTDRRDSVMTRVKVKPDSCGYHSNMQIPNTLTAGDYTLTAYTYWMRNWDEAYFFRKKIKIVNPIDGNMQINTSYIEGDKGEMLAHVSLLDGSKEPIRECDLIYSYKDAEGEELRFKTATNERGEFEIELPRQVNEGYISVKSDDEDYPFDQYIALPQFTDSLDLQFFPEGGDLLAGQLQSVAFKAVGADGKGRTIQGSIYNSMGDSVASLNTTFKGMGLFYLQVQDGESYYAVIKGKDGINRRTELPQVASSGCAIAAIQRGEKLMYRVLATPDMDATKMGVVVHLRGREITSYPLTTFNKFAQLSLSDVPQGILTLALVNLDNFEPVSERLIFVDKTSNQSEIIPNDSLYDRRSKVDLTLTMRDATGNPVAGSFALAVTDRKAVKLDMQRENIVSSLLLTSDLKGYIEDATDYFTSDRATDSKHRDLLMMTHGWSRFTLDEVLRQSDTNYTFPVERSQIIEGETRRLFGNPARGASIMVYNFSTGQMDFSTLDKDTHEFRLDGLDYPDSTKLVIQALDRFGSSHSMSLRMKPESFSHAEYFYPHPLFYAESEESQEEEVPDNFVLQSKQKYYFEGGMRVYELDEVTVTSERKRATTTTTKFNFEPTTAMSQDEMKRYEHLSVFEALKMMYGIVTDDEGNIMLRHSDEAPVVVLDESEVEMDFVSILPMSQVESLGLLTGGGAAVYGYAAGGVILITLKQGADVDEVIPTAPSMANIRRLGYKKPVAFYQPQYEIPEKLRDPNPDLRTTIYWNPSIVTDSTGVANLSFFTADGESTYDIVVEGISNSGDVIRVQSSVDRKVAHF